MLIRLQGNLRPAQANVTEKRQDGNQIWDCNLHKRSDMETRYLHPLETSGNRHPQVDDNSSRRFFRILPRDTPGFSLFPIHRDRILKESTRKGDLNRFDLFHKLAAKPVVETSVGHCHTA